MDRAVFFARFQDADAIRYFYEPFLAAFDPALRKELGVRYTPREIVRYMVERVDRVLRDELGLADGLADPSVWVLDPCCGTGAYLVEVLARIERTLRAKGDDALVAADLKEAATTRVAGFEIMPAPYVVAHWQMGHALRAAGAPLGDGERAAVYLTNALTGWAAPGVDAGDGAPAGQQGIRYTFPPLADERDEATRVKQARPILVVLGNPPYNAFAGTSPAEESGLVEPYKVGAAVRLGGQEIQPRRSVRAVLSDCGAPHRRGDRAWGGVLHQQPFLAVRAIVRRDAAANFGGVRPDLDRQHERLEV